MSLCSSSLSNHNKALGNLVLYGSFRKLGVPHFGVLIIRILLFRVLYQGPLFSETPILILGTIRG